MTYLPVPPEVVSFAGCVSVRIPRELLARVLVQVAGAMRSEQGGLSWALWNDMGYAAARAEDDSLDPDDREAEAENALTAADELLDMASVYDGLELSWPAAERLGLRLLHVAEVASGGLLDVPLAQALAAVQTQAEDAS